MCDMLLSSSNEFSEIIKNIKSDYLSREPYPKLVFGTGLSRVYGLPGMNELFNRLEQDFDSFKDVKIKAQWKTKIPAIKASGLEAGLASITSDEEEMVDTIKHFTAKYVLEEELRLHQSIYATETGFKKLLRYLMSSCSVNRRVLDVMTPNYDRVVEIVCDSLHINLLTGYLGQSFCHYNQSVMRNPAQMFKINSNNFVRLYKPHGSINWVNFESGIKQIIDNKYLLDHSEDIEIVAPGSMKYKTVTTVDCFRYMRDNFVELLENEKTYTLFIFGYGFNDAHFNTVFNVHFNDKKSLIVSKEISSKVIGSAMQNQKMVAFYQDEGQDYMIYKCKKHKIDLDMWNINTFANVFIA